MFSRADKCRMACRVPLLLLAVCMTSIPSCQGHAQFTACVTQTGPCSCETTDGLIDLSPLASTDGTPRFRVVHDVLGLAKYSYNPCVSFSMGLGSLCRDVAVCRHERILMYRATGDQTSALFRTVPAKGLQITYQTDDQVKRHTHVTLECDQSEEGLLRVVGETSKAVYEMTLTSKYACPIASGATSSGLTPTVTNPGYNFTTVLGTRPTVATSTAKATEDEDCECWSWKTISLILLVTLMVCVTVCVMGLCWTQTRKASQPTKRKHKDVYATKSNPYQKF